MTYKEFGATIAPSNVSSTGFPIAMGTHIGGGRIVNDKTTLKHWCLLGEGATLNDQKANAIGQIWYDTSDNKYWKLDSWASENPVWVDVSTIFATISYVDDAINNIPDPMIFKGSLGTGGTITSLPTASTSNTGSNIGFTYKVITAGTYAGQVAKIGDTFISDGTTWNLIPSGDDSGGGSVTSITLNATSPILIDDSNAITTSGTRTFSHASTSGNKHIPSGGSANNYLKWDSDGTATWSALPAASTSVAGITTVGANGGAASYVHNHAKSDITDFAHTHAKSDITDFAHNHDALYAKVGNSFYYVVGNTTGTVGTWTGTISEVTSLYAGLTIAYKIGIAGASATTLNINSLGPNTVLRNTGNLTTHLPVETVVVLTFDGTYWRWADYVDGDTFDRTYWNNTITAGATIYDYKLLAQGLDGKFYPLTLEEGTGTTKTISTQEFEINTQILYYGSTTNVIANNTTANVYSEFPVSTLSYTANQTSWTSQLPIYLVGIVQPNGNIKLDNSSYTSFMTQTLPTTANGKVYIMLGYMYSTTGMRLFQYHPMYEYRNGALRVYMPVHSHGNITDGGAIGTTSGLMVKTTISGVLTTLPAGTSGQFLQYDGTWAVPTGTYSLPLASNGTRGGIQIGYTATGANLPLLLNSEKGYVTLTSSSIRSALGYTPIAGAVTSVSTGLGLTGGPITITGTIDLDAEYGDSVNPYGSKTGKHVLAAPNAGDGVPSFRLLVASDIPTLNQNTTGSAGSVVSSITFNDGGTGDTSGTTYNGSTAQTISYNTIGAAASSHTHSTYENQTLTSGNGMAAWTATNGNLTIALGTPSEITTSTTNSLTTTSHTHAISITPANIGAAPSSHTHDYSLLDNLPNIYNPDHVGVPTNDFDTLYNKPNDVWFCINSMRYGPLNDSGNTNTSHNTSFDYCVVQQFGDKDAYTKVQVLYITTENVTNLSKGSIFYRIQGDNKWKRIATYSDIVNLQTQIGNLTTTVNNKQDKRSIITNIDIPSNGSVNIDPSANKVQYINLSGQPTIHTINLSYLNSLDEYTMIITNPNNASGLVINVDSFYKFVGVIPSWSFNSWVICIWKAMIFANILNL